MQNDSTNFKVEFNKRLIKFSVGIIKFSVEEIAKIIGAGVLTMKNRR